RPVDRYLGDTVPAALGHIEEFQIEPVAGDERRPKKIPGDRLPKQLEAALRVANPGNPQPLDDPIEGIPEHASVPPGFDGVPAISRCQETGADREVRASADGSFQALQFLNRGCPIRVRHELEFTP